MCVYDVMAESDGAMCSWLLVPYSWPPPPYASAHTTGPCLSSVVKHHVHTNSYVYIYTFAQANQPFHIHICIYIRKYKVPSNFTDLVLAFCHIRIYTYPQNPSVENKSKKQTIQTQYIYIYYITYTFTCCCL